MSVKTLKTPFTDREIAQVEITSAHGCGIRMVDPGTYVFRATMPWMWAETDELAEDAEGVTLVDAGEEVTVTLEPGDEPVVYYCKLSEELPGQMTPLRVVYDRPAPVDGVNGEGLPAGGTTGQVLAKTSNSDFATQWNTPSTSPVTGGYGEGTDPGAYGIFQGLIDGNLHFRSILAGTGIALSVSPDGGSLIISAAP